MTNEVLEAIKKRRSVRAYKPDQITAEELQAVLDAGAYAASGMGWQSPKFVVVQKKETRDLISRLNGIVMGNPNDPFYGAPTIINVFADTNRFTWHEDGSLAIGNMLLAAYAVGLGSCWIHRAREIFAGEEGKKLMKKWGLGDNYAGIGHVALGYAANPLPPAKPRKPDYTVWD